jgi:hypothetical protein
MTAFAAQEVSFTLGGLLRAVDMTLRCASWNRNHGLHPCASLTVRLLLPRTCAAPHSCCTVRAAASCFKKTQMP